MTTINWDNMNFLQKILLMIVLISLKSESIGEIPLPPALPPLPVANPILDLPVGAGGTPGLHMVAGGALQPVLITKSVNNQNASCLHVIVPGTTAAANGINARNFDGNIYFPRNGVQPTTPEAVEYSCANIDNRENSPITEWYMMMFGVIPFQNAGAPSPNDYIKAGKDNKNTAYRIIDTSALLTSDQDNELPRKYLHQRDAFEKNFRKIASTSVGRVLLYRILIETMRCNRTMDNAGCIDSGLKNPLTIARRNDCRHLTINWKSEGNSFVFTSKIINFGIQFPTRKLTTVGSQNANGYHEIILYPRSNDVGLVHEMIHWYHFLRNPDRYVMERNADNGSTRIDGTRKDGSLVIHIGKYYWPVADDKWKLSAIPWIVVGKKKEELVVSFEEIRTILGSHSSISEYISGDDISENLYRSCNEQPLRFGHSSTAFYEDKTVIDKVKSACDEKRIDYSSLRYSYTATSSNKNDKPRFDYSFDGLKKGIGNFKIPQFDVNLVSP